MYQFNVICPKTLGEVCAALKQAPEETAVIAGGTDLMVQIHEKSRRAAGIRTVISLSQIKDFDTISCEDGMVRIGAGATHTEISKNPIIIEHAPALAAACLSVGSPQIRNTGTIGGAVGNASPASDPLPVLLALGASAVAQGTDGTREIPMSEMVTKPGKTSLEPGEVIAAFVFPFATQKKSAFIKLGRRKALSISRMNVTAIAEIGEDQTIRAISLVPGCVFAKPEHAEKAEALLLNKKADAALIREAAALVAEEMIEKTGVRWSTEYKKPVVTALTERALGQVLEVEL